MRDRGLRYWLASYVYGFLKRAMSGNGRVRPRHVMFLICDHYEPRHNIGREHQDVERVDTWVREYPRFYRRCADAFGKGPRHSWFYPPHHGLVHLGPLSGLAFDGYGEVELHFHHDGDTSATLKVELSDTIAAYNRRGLLLAKGETPTPCFSFIHGDWALDNSAGGKYCGVDDELTILRELGCWGDFTMPSANECQTRKINAIYYAVDNPGKPKSHDSGIDLRVGGQPPEDGFFLMQGPLGVNWFASPLPKIENANLTINNWGREDRVKFWLRCGIHVQGRPEWVFVKLHAHGAIERDFDALFGDAAFEMHRLLNEHCGQNGSELHYVTAREAYNICKAAEAGCDGNPDEYRDFVLSPYVNTIYHLAGEHVLTCCTDERLHIKDIADGAGVLRARGFAVEEISGDGVCEVDLRRDVCELEWAGGRDGEPLKIVMSPGHDVLRVSGAEVVADTHVNSRRELAIKPGAGRVRLATRDSRREQGQR